VHQPLLISIQAGLPQSYTTQSDVGPAEKTWTTAFSKQRVNGPVWVGKENLDGDGQANTKTHGGAEKAICVYPVEHYGYWQEHLGLPELSLGAFAENFTTRGLLENQVCIGDVFALSEVVVQVSQPRPPCWRLSRWWCVKDFAARMEQTGRTGWYLRVIREGYIESDTHMELIERRHPEWSVATANNLMWGAGADLSQMRELAACTSLSNSWRDAALSRVRKLSSSGIENVT